MVSPAEMQILVSRAGLTLNPGQMADLVLAWRQVIGLLALIPHDRPLVDDQAFVFRLPPPAATAGAAGAVQASPSGRSAGTKADSKQAAGSKSVARQPSAKKIFAKKILAKKTPAKTAAANKITAKEALAKQSGAKTLTAKRPGGKKPTAKRPPGKRQAARRTTFWRRG